MRNHNKGFTLLELLIIIVILGLTMAIAAPSLGQMIVNSRISGGANDLAAAMQFAKTEAVARVNPATLCKRNNAGTNCRNGGDWSQGWIVFSDLNGDAGVDGDDTILLVHEALDQNLTFGGTAGVDSFITYRPSGTSTVTNTEVLIICEGNNFAENSRGILVTITGRGSVMRAPDTGQNACL